MKRGTNVPRALRLGTKVQLPAFHPGKYTDKHTDCIS
eukprot:SAG31_NODE_30686_length_377_cov_1.115108_1_plen_36_part_10